MAFTVSEFKSNIASNGGGARPNLFTVSISGKTTAIGFDKDENILVKAAQIPGSTIAAQTLTYLGRPIKYTGFRTYDNWTTTVMNDENFTARDKISQWIDKKFQITETLEENPNDKRALFYSIFILIILWVGRLYLIWSHLFIRPSFFDYALK